MTKKKKKKQWFRLDNAAKIFPPTSNKRDPRVFRFSCELYEKIEPEILKVALAKNLKLFPGFLVVLKQGLFWYYLEETDREVKIKEETIPPCSPIYDADKKRPLFRIQYYHNRIHLEVYHALTDGTGALEFLKSLVTFYLIEKEGIRIDNPILEYDASITEKMDDSFQKYYERPKTSFKIRRPRAYQIKGERLYDHRLRLIEGHLKLDKLLELARQYHTTITVFITAVFMKAIEKEMSIREKEKPVTVMIPINLRKHFESVTARNFFSICYTSYYFGKDEDDSLEAVIRAVDTTLKHELEPEILEQTVNQLVAFEKNPLIRVIPTFLKDLVLKTVNELSGNDNTSVVSNIGKVEMPKELTPYVKQFHVFVSTPKKQICVCSYLNQLSIGFTSSFVSTDIEKNFFRILTELGLDVEIVTNPLDE